MKKQTLTLTLILTLIVAYMLFNVPETNATTTTTLTATKDAYVDQDNPDTNYGSATELIATTDLKKYLLVSFDISSLPSSITIVSATLKIYCTYKDGSYDMPVYKINDDSSWSESTVTWNNAPSYDSTALDTTTITTGWNSYTVTNAVKQVVNAGNSSVGFVIASPEVELTVVTFKFASKEYDGYDAQLEITYSRTPTIGEFASPSTVYANQYFMLNATVNDPDGISDFQNATLELTGNITLKWINETDTFSIHEDPNGYCTIDSTNSFSEQVNSTALKLVWKIKLDTQYYMEYPTLIDIVEATVYDSVNLKGTNTKDNLFEMKGVYHNPQQPVTVKTKLTPQGGRFFHLYATIKTVIKIASAITYRYTPPAGGGGVYMPSQRETYIQPTVPSELPTTIGKVPTMLVTRTTYMIFMLIGLTVAYGLFKSANQRKRKKSSWSSIRKKGKRKLEWIF